MYNNNSERAQTSVILAGKKDDSVVILVRGFAKMLSWQSKSRKM